jgi:hypothetical protein
VKIKAIGRSVVADEGHEDAEHEDDQANDAEGDGDVIGGDDAGDVLEDGEDGEREADEDGKQDGDLHRGVSRDELIGRRAITGRRAQRIGWQLLSR